MRPQLWKWLNEFRKLWESPLPEPGPGDRILKLQRNIVLPAKLVILAVVFYYLMFSDFTWMMSSLQKRHDVRLNLLLATGIYSLINLAVMSALFLAQNTSAGRMQWLALGLGFLDGIFLGTMTGVSGGFESTLFWAFPGLIVINALSIPLATPQIILNLSLSAFYMGAGIWSANLVLNAPYPEVTAPTVTETHTNQNTMIARRNTTHTGAGEERRDVGMIEQERALALRNIDTFLLRLIVLWLLTACCYGVQVLAARRRQAEEEAREFAVRQGQLRTAGRMAAEIAHQVKNPLAIINNATYSMRRAILGGKMDVMQQLDIIREEIERSDRIITQLMGYARLAEGRVERVSITEELDRALDEVYPQAIGYDVEIHRDYGTNLPRLVMQREHLNTMLVNLFQNSREAMDGHGRLLVGVHLTRDYLVEITIQDSGPGIPADQSERIFEPYYTTREKGTGLGLTIVKHNVDLYGGSIRVESELGKGARFVLKFSARTLHEPAKSE